MSQDSRDWLKAQITLPVVLHVAVTLCSLTAMFVSLKSDVQDLTRRVVVLEQEIVPRKEHEVKDKLEEQKDRLLDERLQNIERMLGQLASRR